MPNRKHCDAKRKHKKRKERQKKNRITEMKNAKKSTLKNLSKKGCLPKELQDRC